MIEGLKVTVPGPELVAMCLRHAEFHESRVAFYLGQKEALPEIDEETPDFSNVSKKPREMMSERIKTHKAEAQELRFYAKYLKAGEDYLLDRSDLSRLGIVSNRY
jgi:hypothetical protein